MKNNPVMPIYELEQDYEKYLNMLTSDDAEELYTTEEIDELRHYLNIRGNYAVRQYQLMRDTFEDYIKVLKDKVSELQARVKYLQRLDEIIKSDIVTAMEILGTKTVHLPECTVSLKAGSKSVNVYDIDKLPAKYTRATIKLNGELAEKILKEHKGEDIKVIFEADKTAIKALNEKGLGAIGAEIVTGDPIISVKKK